MAAKTTLATRTHAAWEGIDPDTRDFIRRMVSTGRFANTFRTAACDWLSACRDAGLSTALDADLTDPRYVALYDARVTAATSGIELVRRRHTRPVRDGLRFYVLALEDGLRTRPVPAEALPMQDEWGITVEDARAKLPVTDQEKLAAVDALFLALAKKQYAGDGDRVRLGSDGRKRKITMSFSTQEQTRRVMDDFIRHCALTDKTPFTFEGLLTPANVTAYLFYGAKPDGSFYDIETIAWREEKLLNYIHRARISGRTPIEIVTAEREAELRAAILAEQDRRLWWHTRSSKLGNRGPNKWYPTLDQVNAAIGALEERIARLEDRWAHRRITRRAYWRKLRDAVLTLCTLYGMWRVDTASTLCLLHLKRHGPERAPVDANGFAVIEKIVRAKDSTGAWYPFVGELTLSPLIVRLVQKLLALEGRALDRPLLDGEAPITLSAEAGDRWGDDPVLDGEVLVAPIFRVVPDRPAGLTYDGVGRVLQRQLGKMRFGATNPHTLRAAGAIYWSFVVGMPEALVMKLGLWVDAKTLRDCYAKIQGDDQRDLMSGFMPPHHGSVPSHSRGRREQAAVAALGVLGKMLEKPTDAQQARRLLVDLRRQFEAIDQTIAAELGRRWEPIRPDRFRPGEVEQIDEELRVRGRAGGIEALIGRRLFAYTMLKDLAAAAVAQRHVPPAIRSRWDVVTPDQAVQPAGTGSSTEAA